MTLEEAERQYQAREFRRRRIVRSVRGYLYADRRVNRVTARIFVICVVAFVVGSVLFHACGLKSLLLRWPLSVAGAMAVGVWVCRRTVDSEFRKFEMTNDPSRYLAVDDAMENSFAKDEIDAQIDRGFRAGLQGGNSQPGGGCIVLILYVLVRFSWYLSRDFWRIAPSILAEIFVDGPLVERLPQLAHQIPTRKWYVTALDFFAVRAAAVAMLLATVAILFAVMAPDATTFGEAMSHIGETLKRSRR